MQWTSEIKKKKKLSMLWDEFRMILLSWPSAIFSPIAIGNHGNQGIQNSSALTALNLAVSAQKLN